MSFLHNQFISPEATHIKMALSTSEPLLSDIHCMKLNERIEIGLKTKYAVVLWQKNMYTGHFQAKYLIAAAPTAVSLADLSITLCGQESHQHCVCICLRYSIARANYF